MTISNDHGTPGRETINRRQLLGTLGLAGGCALLLPNRLALGARPDPNLPGMWFEWSDGKFYRHEFVLDDGGLWLDEHDGYYHFYPEYQFTRGGVWLADGTTNEFHYCLSDAGATDSLVEFHWVGAEV